MKSDESSDFIRFFFGKKPVELFFQKVVTEKMEEKNIHSNLKPPDSLFQGL